MVKFLIASAMLLTSIGAQSATAPAAHTLVTLSAEASQALWEKLIVPEEDAKKPEQFKGEVFPSAPTFRSKKLPAAGIDCLEMSMFIEETSKREAAFVCTISAGKAPLQGYFLEHRD